MSRYIFLGFLLFIGESYQLFGVVSLFEAALSLFILLNASRIRIDKRHIVVFLSLLSLTLLQAVALVNVIDKWYINIFEVLRIFLAFLLLVILVENKDAFRRMHNTFLILSSVYLIVLFAQYYFGGCITPDYQSFHFKGFYLNGCKALRYAGLAVDPNGLSTLVASMALIRVYLRDDNITVNAISILLVASTLSRAAFIALLIALVFHYLYRSRNLNLGLLMLPVFITSALIYSYHDLLDIDAGAIRHLSYPGISILEIFNNEPSLLNFTGYGLRTVGLIVPEWFHANKADLAVESSGIILLTMAYFPLSLLLFFVNIETIKSKRFITIFYIFISGFSSGISIISWVAALLIIFSRFKNEQSKNTAYNNSYTYIQ